MKEIKAFIRPNKVNDIVHHLKDAGFENMTISSAEGTGKLQDEAAFVSQHLFPKNFQLPTARWPNLNLLSIKTMWTK